MTLIARTGERGVATLTLDSPANRNALSAGLVGALREALAACAADDTVRAVVLTHTGTTFCAGADLTAPPDPEAFVGLMREIVALPKPVVARVDGHVRAGGLGLLAACDIAVAGRASSFALTESRLGLAPAVISLTLLPRLDRTCGCAPLLPHRRTVRRRRRRPGSRWSRRPPRTSTQALVPILDGLRRASPQGLAASKELVTATVLRSFDQYAEDLIARSAALFASDEAREGMTAFLERRDPAWVR
ncbi:enoyl-CoA hydratase family protein [Streptomyces californicus]